MNGAPTPSPADLSAMRELEDRLRARTRAMEESVAGLRNQVRVLGLGLGLALVVIALLIFTPTVFGPPDLGDVVQARTFRIVGSDGIVRGEWGVDEDGAARLSLFDTRTQPRLNLTVLESGFPGMALINDSGQRRAVLGLLPDQTTSLVFADVAGIPRAVLGLTAADEANLVFADAEGMTRMGMGLGGDGIGSVLMPQDTLSGAGEGGGLPIP